VEGYVLTLERYFAGYLVTPHPQPHVAVAKDLDLAPSGRKPAAGGAAITSIYV